MTNTPEGLAAFFAPRSIAVIGASADRSRAGGRVLQTLATAGFAGRVIPVNPNQTQINDLPCHPSILAVPEPVDLVAICVPAERVPDIIRDCGNAGVRGAGCSPTGSATRFCVARWATHWPRRWRNPDCA